MNKSLILFDGVCNLCNGTVQFLIKRDFKDEFRFAPLQSELGEKVSRQLGRANRQSIVLVQSNRIYTKSSAALRIAKHLQFPWKLSYGFILLPRLLRDRIYDYIARNRYRWFGRQESCMVPTPENRRKFWGTN